MRQAASSPAASSSQMLQSLQLLLWRSGEGEREGRVASGERLGEERSEERAEGEREAGERVLRGEERGERRSRGLEWAEEGGESLVGEERQEGDKGRDSGTVHCVLISL